MPNPTEQSAFLGGTIATNASGSRTFAFGSTRENVTSLRTVLANGDIVTARRGQYVAKNNVLTFMAKSGAIYEVPIPTYRMPAVKNAAGLYVAPNVDLVDLLVGSEGILGVTTEIGLSIQPRKEIETYLLFFSSEKDALEFVGAMRSDRNDQEQETKVLSLEYANNSALQITKNERISPKARAAVEVEIFAGDDGTTQRMIEHAERTYIDSWINPKAITALRHSIPERVNSIVAEYGQRKLGTDFAVPPIRFPEMINRYNQTAQQFREQTGIKHATVMFGHVGDCHLHFNFIPLNKTQADNARFLYYQLALQAIAFDGTISAEHGVGKKAFQNQPYLEMMVGKPGLRQIAAVKKAFGSERLNPGNMVPLSYLQ